MVVELAKYYYQLFLVMQGCVCVCMKKASIFYAIYLRIIQNI